MNSPSKFFKAEQLTPSSSPTSLSLDDSSNLGYTPSFVTLLASPTRFKLSEAMALPTFSSSSFNNNSNNKNNNGQVLTTSLSKVKTYKKGTTHMDQKNHDLSYGIFKEQSFPNNNSSSGTKTNKNTNSTMFKEEFVSNYSPLPLFSTLLKIGGSLNETNKGQRKENNRTNITSNLKDNNNNINPLLDCNLSKLSIKETLEKIRKHHQQLNITNNTITNNNIHTTATRRYPQKFNIESNNTIATTSPLPAYNNNKFTMKNINSENAYDDFIATNLQPMEGLLAPPLELHVAQKLAPNNSTTNSSQQLIDDKITFNSSTVYPDHVFSENGLNAADSVLKYPNQSNNRYSFISSTSTDYDTFDFVEQLSPMIKSRSIADINEYETKLESSKLDLKIKQLEVEINELKLQNIKLINSLTVDKAGQFQNMSPIKQTSSTTSQRNSMDLQAQRIDGSDETTRLRNKVKELEKRIDSYKRTISKYQHNCKLVDPSKKKRLNGDNFHHRISRLSSTQLKRFEETTDPSSSFCSEDEGEDSMEESIIFTNGSIFNHRQNGNYNKNNKNNNRDGEYEADIEEHTIEMPKRKGFDLHFPVNK